MMNHPYLGDRKSTTLVQNIIYYQLRKYRRERLIPQETLTWYISDLHSKRIDILPAIKYHNDIINQELLKDGS